MNCIEISLIADSELCESIADVLSRHIPQGVAIESTAIEVDPDDEGRPIGPLKVRGFLPDDDQVEATREKIERDLFYLNMIRPIPQPTYTKVADADWTELWKEHYKPIRAGKRLIVVPAWLKPELDSNDVPVYMDPGMAFGTGTHPTTQLCLALLEDHIKPNDNVLDVGCGSGILSIAAAKLGAADVQGIDIDNAAIHATNENAQANGVAAKITARLGSLTNLQFPTSSFDLTVANILARVIIKLLEDEGLAHTIQRNGILIVSGILEEQANNVIAALDKHGLKVVDKRQSGEWVGIAASRG
ncbi:MAG: 50S ribosomal protein L11 methyltransferase [Chloroflexi bacterium]|nr:50S ribosomal protein L11 methyltransferase [Chloroflexota bacterium]